MPALATTKPHAPDEHDGDREQDVGGFHFFAECPDFAGGCLVVIPVAGSRVKLARISRRNEATAGSGYNGL